MTLDTKQCVVCGADYTPRSKAQILCGNKECRKIRHRQYIREHADLYRRLNKEYREKEENKQYRADYDKEYQKKNKQRIKQYKKLWWLKKNFFDHLAKGKIKKNSYWYSLTIDEQNKYIEQVEKQNT